MSSAVLDAKPRPTADARPARDWAVVGGGVLGMELARQLTDGGNRVTLIEAASHLGGVADAWSLGGLTWDRHYHVTLMSDTRLRELLFQLGLTSDVRWVETRTGFFTGGKLYSMSDVREFLRFPPLRLLDKLRLGLTIRYASGISNWKRLERIPVADWLRRWSGRRTTEAIWLPLLRAKLGENYAHASAAFIWAIIARMYAARRTGLKKEMFGYVRGGYARVLDRFAALLGSAGVDVRTGTPVTAVRPDGGRVRVESAAGTVGVFDQVVVTAASPVAARLCPDLPAGERDRHDALRYQGIVCASVVLKGPLDRFYVTNITEPGLPFTAVIEMTALVDPKEFGGKHLVYLPKYVTPDDPLFDQSGDAIRESFLAGLAKMYPHFDPAHVEAFRVSRVRHVLAVSTLNYSDTLPPMTTGVPGVHVVNGAHITNGTLNVNETLLLADRAAKHLLAGVRR